jgi:hypothetical protein
MVEMPTLVQNPPTVNNIVNPNRIMILDCLLWVDSKLGRISKKNRLGTRFDLKIEFRNDVRISFLNSNLKIKFEVMGHKIDPQVRI